LCYSVLLEFFAVVTDSRRVGNPLPPVEAWREVDAYLNTFEVLYPDEGTFAQLGKLAKQYQTTRQTIFDVLIVAMMIQADSTLGPIGRHGRLRALKYLVEGGGDVE